MPPSNDFLAKPESRIAGAKVYDKQLVRTDSRDQKINKFLSTTLESVPSSNKTSQSLINQTLLEKSQESFAMPSKRKEPEQQSPLVFEPVKTIQVEPERNSRNPAGKYCQIMFKLYYS